MISLIISIIVICLTSEFPSKLINIYLKLNLLNYHFSSPTPGLGRTCARNARPPSRRGRCSTHTWRSTHPPVPALLPEIKLKFREIKDKFREIKLKFREIEDNLWGKQPTWYPSCARPAATGSGSGRPSTATLQSAAQGRQSRTKIRETWVSREIQISREIQNHWQCRHRKTLPCSRRPQSPSFDDE